MGRKIAAQSGHEMDVTKIPAGSLPQEISSDAEAFDKFYEVRNWDAKGIVFMYLAKGHASAPNQVCVFYRNSSKLWAGYGDNFKEAIDGAQKDGWLYA